MTDRDWFGEAADTPALNFEASLVPEEFRASKKTLIESLVATQLRQKKAEAEQLALVSAVCDAYSTLEPNPAGDVDDASQVLFGEKLLPPSFEGPGPVAEFLGHELGPALGMSSDTAWKLVWDVLALRHRHPVLWNLTLTLQVEAWRARMVARMCFALSEEHARTLDSELGPKLPGWGPVKTRKEVERMRARLDPKAERDRQQARDGRMVDFSPHRACQMVCVRSSRSELE